MGLPAPRHNMWVSIVLLGDLLMIRSLFSGALVGILSASALVDQAQQVGNETSFRFNGEAFTSTRAAQVNVNKLVAFARPSLSCEGSCLSPMSAAEGVTTIGELDVMSFMTEQVAAGSGLILDARMPEQRAVGFIPASVSVPVPTMAADNPYRVDILRALGAKTAAGVSNFSGAVELVIFDAGPGTTDAQRLISTLLDSGYPAEKVKYYRGGMQIWTALGLTTQETPS